MFLLLDCRLIVLVRVKWRVVLVRVKWRWVVVQVFCILIFKQYHQTSLIPPTLNPLLHTATSSNPLVEAYQSHHLLLLTHTSSSTSSFLILQDLHLYQVYKYPLSSSAYPSSTITSKASTFFMFHTAPLFSLQVAFALPLLVSFFYNKESRVLYATNHQSLLFVFRWAFIPRSPSSWCCMPPSHRPTSNP